MAITGQAATYTYNPPLTADLAETWSSTANWNALPVSGTNTRLTLINNGTFTNGTDIVSTNDLGLFSLNALDLQGVGPSAGAATFALSGSALQFVRDGVTSPVLNLTATGNKLTYTISPTINLADDLTVQGNGTANFIHFRRGL